MTTFERKPFDENPYWSLFQGYGSEDVMNDFQDK
jgi:hypothetical protein